MIPHIAGWGHFTFLSIKSRLGSFSSLWMTLMESHVDLFQDSHPWHRAPKHLSDKVYGGGVAEHVQSLKENGTNGSIRQNTVNKRDERWKASFFSETLQLMSGQKVTVYTPVALVRLKEPSQQQLSPHFHSAFILCCNYSRGLSALWALSGGATPSAASESVLSTISPRCAHYTFKRNRWWCTAKILSEFAITI